MVPESMECPRCKAPMAPGTFLLDSKELWDTFTRLYFLDGVRKAVPVMAPGPPAVPGQLCPACSSILILPERAKRP